MIEFKKKPQVEMIRVWIWSVKDEWIFSMLPDEGCGLFYANAGWHLDRAKEFFAEHKGFPMERIEFIQCEAPERIRRLKPPPGSRRQLMELERRKLEKPIYAGEAEIKKRGEFIRKMNEEIRSNPNTLRTITGSVITYEQKRFAKKIEDKGWKASVDFLSEHNPRKEDNGKRDIQDQS